MQVFLTEKINKIGKEGDLVKVKDGFARNFLFPKKLAVPVTRGSQSKVEEQKKNILISLERSEKKGAILKDKIEKAPLTISVKAGEGKKIFGSVTNQVIQKELVNNGIKIDRKKIILEKPLQELGDYDILIKLTPNIEATLKLSIANA